MLVAVLTSLLSLSESAVTACSLTESNSNNTISETIQIIMAEVAAGALVAEQVIATTVEGAALTGYAVSKPTMPLKASFTQIATAPKDDSE